MIKSLLQALLKTQRLSLRFRAACVSAATLLAFFSLAAFGLQAMYDDSLNNAAEGELKAYMLSLLGEMDFDQQGQLQLYDLSVAAFNQPNSGVYAEIWHQSELQWRSESLIGKGLPETTSRLGEYQLSSAISGGSQQYNILSLLVDWQEEGLSKQFSLVVAHDAEPYIQRQAAFKQRLNFWLIMLGLTLLVLQLILFRWLFRPITKVSEELVDIQAGTKKSFNNVYPQEVSVLTNSLDEFLVNERFRIQKVRESLANLAHSLKTPLAVIRSELSNKKTDKFIMSENIDRIDQIIDYQLNKTSNSVRPSYRQAQLCFVTIERLVNALQRLHQDKGLLIAMEIEKPEKLIFRGDLDDLAEILGNLLENACKWASSQVLLKAANKSDKLELQIIDDGPGIPQENIEDVLQRGKRLDSKTEGQGIGLAIVSDLVESYSGELELSSLHGDSKFKNGLLVVVRI